MTTSQVTTRPAAQGEPAGGPEAAAPPPEAYRIRARKSFGGPRRLTVRTLTALLLTAALAVLAVTGAVSVRHHTDALRTTVMQRAAVAAELRFALADMDAERADALAPGMSPDGKVTVGNQLNALITAQQRRAQVSDLLRQLGADTSQSEPVRALLDALGRYDDLSGRSSYVDEQDPARLAGHPPRYAVSMNVQAGVVMSTELLEDARALSVLYSRQAAASQADAHRAAVLWAVGIGVLAVATLAFLVWWQRRLAREYRRTLNPPMAAATAAVLAIGLAGLAILTSCASDVNTAGREGFAPWTRLAEARAVAAQAAATESRWFVHDNAFGVGDEARFTELTGDLAPLLASPAGASAEVRAAYADVRTRYGHFLADDRELRKLKAQGRVAEAAAVLTEVGRGDVAFDFWDFATTLDSLAAQQLREFSVHADAGRGALDGWPAVPAGALGAGAVLIVLGVRPRLREYV